MAKLPRWLRPRTVLTFLALELAGNSALAAMSWGLGLVFGLFLTLAADIPWYLKPILFLGLVLIGAGITALLLRRFVPAAWLEPPPAMRTTQLAEQPDTPGWESVVDATATETVTFLLRVLSVPQIVRGLACDIKAPRAAFPVRATVPVQGLTTEAHVHYPENFPEAVPVFAGTYRVVWYAADPDGEWRELVRATHHVTPGSSTPQAPESATD